MCVCCCVQVKQFQITSWRSRPNWATIRASRTCRSWWLERNTDPDFLKPGKRTAWSVSTAVSDHRCPNVLQNMSSLVLTVFKVSTKQNNKTMSLTLHLCLGVAVSQRDDGGLLGPGCRSSTHRSVCRGATG